jgi:hypothetical protein
MMLPMRISVSVTPAVWAGCGAAKAIANIATTGYSASLAFGLICINMASNAKLPGACDANPAAAIIARKIGLLK